MRLLRQFNCVGIDIKNQQNGLVYIVGVHTGLLLAIVGIVGVLNLKYKYKTSLDVK
jgi:hypothetical protein